GLLVPPLGGDVGVREVGDHVSHVGSLRLVVPEKPNPATPPGNRGTRALLPGGCGSAPLPGLAARLPDRLLGVLPGGLRLPQDPLALGLLAGLRVRASSSCVRSSGASLIGGPSGRGPREPSPARAGLTAGDDLDGH